MSSAATKTDGCVHCGEMVDLSATPETTSALTSVMVQSDDLCVTRMVVSPGQELPPQRSLGDATVHCLEGSVDFTVDDETHHLTAGKMIYLGAKMPYSITGIDDAVLLVTMVVPNDRYRKPLDTVQEASEESFPASDPPAHG